MTQQTDSAPKPLSNFWLRPLMLQSLSCLGIFTLSSNAVFAQTEAAIDPIVVSTSQDSQPAVKTRANSAHNSQARWNRLGQQLRAKTPIRQKQVQRAVSYSSQLPQAKTLRQKLNTAAISGRQQQSLKARVSDYSSSHIDPTAYKIGATTGYEAPRSVVLAERSTGCRTVARSGLSGRICGSATGRVKIAFKGRRSLSTVRLAGRRAPGWVSKSRIVAKAGVQPIRVGPIAVGSNGFRLSSNPDTKRLIVTYNRSSQPSEQSSVSKGFLFPLTVPAPITSLFGWRIHPITGDRRFHAGTDLGAPLGTPILAAAAGQVAIADFLGGYGLTVVLEHEELTRQTLYAHMSEIFVEPGEWVAQGTVIGRVGSTGNSTGPHLHFETRELTASGWVATDHGIQLQQSLAQLVEALRFARLNQKSGA